MTIQEYIKKYDWLFPLYIRDNELCISSDNQNEFKCFCGQHCFSYGWYKFQYICIDCAIDEFTSDLMWEWIYLQDGANCLSKEKFLNTYKRYRSAQDYGHRNMNVLKFIVEEAYKKFKKFADNFIYEYEYQIELGLEHQKAARECENQNYITDILKHTKRNQNVYSEYFDILNKLNIELNIPRRDIPKELVLTELNLINQKRLIRQRRKNV